MHKIDNTTISYLFFKFSERFVNVSDADKRGLPRVIASLYVSSKSREDIRSLCSLLYQVAGEMRSIGSGSGRKSKLLVQKVPASFVALEKASLLFIIKL